MTSTSVLTRTRLVAFAAAATLGTLMLIVPAAKAGPLVASDPDCAEEALTNPFLPWVDPMDYQFAPDGGFEAGAEGWSLAGGATAVSGNESYYLHDSVDSRSLSLREGGSATSPTVCVGLEHPTIRFLAKGKGLTGSLAVSVRFEDASGEVHSAPIGAVGRFPGWQPSAPMPIVANLLPLLPGDHTPVQFTFRSLDGDWQIDDVYVDPRRNS